MKTDAPEIFRIQRFSIHDGPGIRTTLFFQGCPLSCPWCHNPESQAMDPTIERAVGRPGSATRSSRLVQNLIQEIEKDMIFYDESQGGVTFSGGEPLSRPKLLMALIEACRQANIHTCLDTSGFAPEKVIKAAARAVDLVLYDIKVFDEKKHENLTGKSSKIILANLEMLDQLGVPLKLRFPLIPSMTDYDENITQIIEFLVSHTRYRDIHILPFHNTGADKYRQMNLTYPMTHIRPPGRDDVEAVALKFKKSGFNPVIGG